MEAYVFVFFGGEYKGKKFPSYMKMGEPGIVEKKAFLPEEHMGVVKLKMQGTKVG